MATDNGETDPTDLTHVPEVDKRRVEELISELGTRDVVPYAASVASLERQLRDAEDFAFRDITPGDIEVIRDELSRLAGSACVGGDASVELAGAKVVITMHLPGDTGFMSTHALHVAVAGVVREFAPSPEMSLVLSGRRKP